MTALNQIEARLNAATPGPRWVAAFGEFAEVYAGEGGGDDIMLAENIYTRDDAEFIANAPADIARLLAAVKEVMDLADYWQTLAPGDQHYAKRIQKAINEALEES